MATPGHFHFLVHFERDYEHKFIRDVIKEIWHVQMQMGFADVQPIHDPEAVKKSLTKVYS